MKRLLFFLLLATSLFGQGQDSIRAVGGVLTISIVPARSFYKVFVDQTITSTVFTNQVAGTIVTVYFLQDSTGHSVIFGGNIVGSCTVSQSASATTTIQFAFDSSNNQWASFGCGGGGTPGQFSVTTYGAKGDAKSTRDCVATNLSSTFTSASNPWLASDVGKFIFNSQGYGNPPFAPQKITGFNSAGSITVANAAGGTGTGNCVWFTQKEDTAFAATQTAAAAALTSIDPQQNSPTLAYPGTVSCPPGGYVVSQQVINQNAPAGNTNAINFQGAGIGKCIIYLSPDISTSGPALLMYWANTLNLDLAGFTVEGSGMVFNTSGPLIRINASANSHLHDFKVGEVNFTNFAVPIVQVQSTGSLGGTYFEHNHITASGCLTCALVEVDSTSSISFVSNYVANGAGPNLLFNGCGTRAPQGGQCNWIGGYIDECSVNVTQGCTVITGNSIVNFFGTTMLGEPTAANSGAVFVDAGATAYFNDTNIGAFSSTNNANGLQIQSTGTALATGSTIRGNGTGAAVHGQSSTASYVSVGGNTLQNCSILTCTNITPANYATLGTVGATLKSTETHTPNTCYAVTGNLLATAQNLCTLLLDQNYQVVNITAQSGGTTPANSSCTGAPVITLSDGTRTATLTMTTGKTQWSSAVDVSTVGSIFASGATLTVSIGANTCATPPSNVSVNYVLQSAINP